MFLSLKHFIFHHLYFFFFFTPEFIQFVNLNQLKGNAVSHDMCFLMARCEYAVQLHLKAKLYKFSKNLEAAPEL